MAPGSFMIWRCRSEEGENTFLRMRLSCCSFLQCIKQKQLCIIEGYLYHLLICDHLWLLRRMMLLKCCLRQTQNGGRWVSSCVMSWCFCCFAFVILFACTFSLFFVFEKCNQRKCTQKKKGFLDKMESVILRNLSHQNQASSLKDTPTIISIQGSSVCCGTHEIFFSSKATV